MPRKAKPSRKADKPERRLIDFLTTEFNGAKRPVQ